MSCPTLVHDETADELDLGLLGGTIANAGDANSTARTRIGETIRDTEKVTFPGVPGAFEAFHGVHGKPIVWTGEIRATVAGLSAIRTSIEAVEVLAGTFTFTDDDGREYGSCVIESIGLDNKKRLTGSEFVWHVPYSVVLRQLEN